MKKGALILAIIFGFVLMSCGNKRDRRPKVLASQKLWDGSISPFGRFVLLKKS